jgi:hypothetical protein
MMKKILSLFIPLEMSNESVLGSGGWVKGEGRLCEGVV